jgi:hypothetical protein
LGRPPKFSERLFRNVVSKVYAGSLVIDAIESEGISRQAFYSHLQEIPDFRDTLREAQLRGPILNLERHAFNMAKTSVGMVMFLLRNWNAATYGDAKTQPVVESNTTFHCPEKVFPTGDEPARTDEEIDNAPDITILECPEKIYPTHDD